MIGRRVCTALAIALAFGLAACASAPPPPMGPPERVSTGSWMFDFDAGPGVATAVFRSSQGVLLVEINCTAPRGPMEIRDWTWPPAALADATVIVRLGGQAMEALAQRPAAAGAEAGLRFTLPPLAPAVQALAPGARVAVETPEAVHDWGADAAAQITAVANACANVGS